ncbi:MAG: ankyrin repeat domain-containing protein [Pseudomonadota bacterium]
METMGRTISSRLLRARGLALLGACCLGLASACVRSDDRQTASGASPPSGAELHLAAWEGNVERARQLLDNGTAVAEKEQGSEWTPLHRAAMAGHLAVAALLLERGADPNARASYDMTPLHWASIRGHAEAASVLIQRGARVDAANVYGMTPLHEARSPEIALVLLASGANPKAVDYRGMTPLHVARNRAVARLLLAKGADLLTRANSGETAWQLGLTDALESYGLTVVCRSSARLRGETSTFEVLLRNVTTAPLRRVAIEPASPACSVAADPPVFDEIDPAQLVSLRLVLARRAGIETKDGEHPLQLSVRLGTKKAGVLSLAVDTTRGETPEDRGAIKLARGSLLPAPSRAQYLAYGVVPVVLVASFLLWRWQQQRQRQRRRR